MQQYPLSGQPPSCDLVPQPTAATLLMHLPPSASHELAVPPPEPVVAEPSAPEPAVPAVSADPADSFATGAAGGWAFLPPQAGAPSEVAIIIHRSTFMTGTYHASGYREFARLDRGRVEATPARV